MKLLFFFLLSLSCTAQVEITTYNGRKVAIINWEEFVQANVNYESLKFKCTADADSLFSALALRDTANALHIEEIMYLRQMQDSLEQALRDKQAIVSLRESAVKQCIHTVDAYKMDLKAEQKKVRQLRWWVRGLVGAGVGYGLYKSYRSVFMNN